MRALLLRGPSAFVALSLIVFALATQRALRQGESEMHASDRAFDSGELDVAVRHARRAAGLYVPGAVHVNAAYARLRAVALGAERSRDTLLAAAAWRGMRAAALQSRHLWQPHSDELSLAEQNLERLGFGEPARSGNAPAALTALSTLALSAGWLCCGLGGLLAIGQGKRTLGRWALRRIRWPVALVAVGVATVAASVFVG